MNTNSIITTFIAGGYEQIHCEKCEMTFLTNVYAFDDTHVLLEKRSLGLEYYCGAIHQMNLTKVPDIKRIGILDEEDNHVEAPSRDKIYSGEETEFRFIYVMEKLQHLDENDSAYFDRCVKNLEWEKDQDREKIYQGIEKRYNKELSVNISKLYDYYCTHKKALAWDLHGDNLMRRLSNEEIVILDPYTRNA